MATKILDGLFLGNLYDAELAQGDKKWTTISVLEPNEEELAHKSDITIPILFRRGGKWFLDWNKIIEVTDLIEKLLIEHKEKNILLHCATGQERSPFVMQYYLVRYRNMSADKAFEFIEKKRPNIFRCDKGYYW